MTFRWRGPRRALMRLLLWPMILLKTCSPLPAEQLAPTLPAPSESEPMVPLRICEEELTKLEQKSIEQVTKLESDFAGRLRVAVLEAAAEAARPLLVELAGVIAERDVYRQAANQVRAWRVVAIAGGIGALAAGFLVGVLVGR